MSWKVSMGLTKLFEIKQLAEREELQAKGEVAKAYCMSSDGGEVKSRGYDQAWD